MMWILESDKGYNLEPIKNIIYCKEILQRVMPEKWVEGIIKKVANKTAI